MNKIQPKDFIFTLIGHDSDILELKHAPDGWMGYASFWGRDDKYHGISQKIETRFRFIKDGAKFLRKEYEKYRTNAATRIEIKKLDRKTYKYHLCFSGEIDYTQMEDNMSAINADYFDVAIVEAGMRKMLKAREKNVFEIPLENAKEIRVVEAANAWQECKWGFVSEGGFFSPSVVYAHNSFLSANIFSESMSSKQVVAYSETNSTRLLTNRVNILRYTRARSGYHKIDFSLKIYGKLSITGQIADNTLLHGFIEVLHGPSLDEFTDDADPTDDFEIYRTFQIFDKNTEDFNFTLPYPAFEKREIIIRLGIAIQRDSGGMQSFEYEIDANIDFESWTEPLVEPFNIKVVSLYDAFKFLTEKVADAENNGIKNPTAISELMTTGALKDIYLTSGDAIRGIEEAVIKTSFQDFFDSIFCIMPIQMQISGNSLIIEEYEKAFRNNIIAVDLGAARSLKIKPATEYMFNQIVVGSQDKEYKSANGRYEFITENVFSMPLISVSAEKKMIGKYRSDSFGVTDTRLTFERQTTASGSADNDVFFIHAVAKNIKLSESDETTVRMLVPHDEKGYATGDDLQKQRSGIFNMFFTPKRCLMRHGRILAGILQSTNGIVKYETTGKTDARLISRLPEETVIVVERADYNVANIQPVWFPEIYEIECKIPRDLTAAMDANPHGYTQFSYDGKTYRGFTIEIQQEHWSNPAQTVRLLAASEPKVHTPEAGPEPNYSIYILVNDAQALRNGDTFSHNIDNASPLPGFIKVLVNATDAIEIDIKTANGLDYSDDIPPIAGDNIFYINVTYPNYAVCSYVLVVNYPIAFEQVVVLRWGYRLTVINNPNTNDGYFFTDSVWYRNDVKVSEEQSWDTTGDNPDDIYFVELVATGRDDIIRSTKGTVADASLE